MLNIVIPMAGRGSRFANAGYIEPKPLIPVGGKPMIQWVIENVRPNRDHRFIFLCLAEHLALYPDVPSTLTTLSPSCKIVEVAGVTQGAACTVLLARDLINNDDPLMIVNSDQYVEINIDEYLSEMDKRQADGQIMTFWSDHPKWSYCRIDNQGSVEEVVEKKVVSNEATVGIYNYRSGVDFVRAAETMIRDGLKVNNEYYVAPAYNQMIAAGSKIVTVRTGREYDGMFGLGVPEDLDFFKTTKHYQNGWKCGQDRPLVGSEKIKLLTELYSRFFRDRNIAALSAMLSDESVLCDPNVGRIEGKQNVLEFVNKIHNENPSLDFAPINIVASCCLSIIEFTIKLSSGTISGVDLVEWNDYKICNLRVYLN